MTNQRLMLFALFAVAFYFLVIKKEQDSRKIEHYEEDNIDVEEEYEEDVEDETMGQNMNNDIGVIPSSSDNEPETGKCPGFVSSDLLPQKDQSDDFAEFSPANVDSNFLDSARFLSMQTSLIRNPNLQIRPEPEVPRKEVCPWNQSTIYRENTEPAKNHDTLDF